MAVTRNCDAARRYGDASGQARKRARSSIVLFVLALLGTACGAQYSDPIRGQAEPTGDACAKWLTAASCNADAAHECSYQPNPVGCRSDDMSCPAGTCIAGNPFVTREGTTLMLRSVPYRFLGTVSWGMAWTGCSVGSFPDQQHLLTRSFNEFADMRASVLKIWAYQKYAGTSGTDFTTFDRVVAAARRAGMRLIFVLESQNHGVNPGDDACSKGPDRDLNWYTSGYKSPYAGYALSFPDYARAVTSHFKDESVILAWEIMHEADIGDFAVLDAFATNMSNVIHESDPNHLIALGIENGGIPATSRIGSPSNYEKLHSHPYIDLLDAHDFPAQGTVPEGAGALPDGSAELSVISKSLQKPLFAGATAVKLTGRSPSEFQDRAQNLEKRIAAAFTAGYAGILVYDYVPDWPSTTFDFDGRAEEPLAGPTGVIARKAP